MFHPFYVYLHKFLIKLLKKNIYNFFLPSQNYNVITNNSKIENGVRNGNFKIRKTISFYDSIEFAKNVIFNVFYDFPFL